MSLHRAWVDVSEARGMKVVSVKGDLWSDPISLRKVSVGFFVQPSCLVMHQLAHRARKAKAEPVAFTARAAFKQMQVYQSLFTVRQFSKATVVTCPVLLKKEAIFRSEAPLARHFGCPNLMVRHMPVCFDHTVHSIEVFIVHSGGRATIAKFVIEFDTTALEFCKPAINSPACLPGASAPVFPGNQKWRQKEGAAANVNIAKETAPCARTRPGFARNDVAALI
ncbi:hypothetical protein EVAR_74834_1 [Eumeta japonica]|uniref:Uncharacterized protein n=1 Tax=Eumeta variegata TaxID=151549 RepID=A0A4C1SQA0_EUMVA|nr:hypothetical protein EVAR_74834_1 [Eumeta japonica]